MSRRTLIERVRQKGSLVAGFVFLGVVFLSDTPQLKTNGYEFLGLAGILLAFVGVVGRLWCTTYIGGRKDRQLTTDGPYSLWRNPLYVFSFFGLVGILLATRILTLTLIGIAAFFIYYFFIIRSEEQRLQEMFGDEYRSYCAKVKVIVPAVGNYWSRASFDMNPRYFHKAMADAAMFVLVLVVIEAIYRCKILGLIKPVIHFPF